ncbi:DUF334 domain-containing protein [Staphylococcus hominis]|nr:DUF334 domain-containing protein [Staphylococcus hominis]MDH9922583.1 DUF334 domain-containing protein [Staphylococcus hominis]MDH9950575.1 DUF334 domain-containing protein [Staphylococcus hominis]
MSLKAKKENENTTQSEPTPTTSKSTGTPLNNKQNNLDNNVLDEMRNQNKLVMAYIQEMKQQRQQENNEKEKILNDMRNATKDFQDNGKSFLSEEINQVRSDTESMLEEFKKTQETYKKRIKLLYYGLGTMFLAFMFLALATTIGSDLLSFFNIETLQKAIASKLKSSEGFISFLWYLSYYVPYIVFFGIFIFVYEWLRKKLDDKFF